MSMINLQCQKFPETKARQIQGLQELLYKSRTFKALNFCFQFNDI